MIFPLHLYHFFLNQSQIYEVSSTNCILQLYIGNFVPLAFNSYYAFFANFSPNVDKLRLSHRY
jgi:hypothetical protein